MLNTDQIEGIIPLRNRKRRGLENLGEERAALRSRFRESELKKSGKYFRARQFETLKGFDRNVGRFVPADRIRKGYISGKLPANTAFSFCEFSAITPQKALSYHYFLQP